MKTIIAFLMVTNLCLLQAQEKFEYVQIFENGKSETFETKTKLSHYIDDGHYFYIIEMDGNFYEYKIHHVEYSPQGTKLHIDSFGSYMMVFKNSLGLHLVTKTRTLKFFFYNETTKRV
jgi:hypothetical protein